MTTERKFPEGLLGKKLGMTQIFGEDGVSIPVTVLEMGPCTILQVRRSDSDGYEAVQFGYEPKKVQKVTKPLMGHFNKTGKGAFYHVREMRCDAETLGWTEPGHQVLVDHVFAADDVVDVTGISIGKGFAGVLKRHNMKGQPATRGTHEAKRNIGSIGNCKTPARVFKNKRMPGQMGNAMVTVQNLKVVAVHPDEGIILVRGCVPGSKGSIVEVRQAMKSYRGAVKRVPEAKQAEAENVTSENGSGGNE